MKKKVKEVGEVQIGYQPRGRIDHDPAGTYKIIQVKDFDSNNELNETDLYRITPEREPEKYQVDKGDVLFLSRGRSNFASAIRHPVEAAMVTNTFYIVRVRTDIVLPEYLSWFINQPSTLGALRKMAQATSIPLISKAAFEDLEMDIPSIAIQRRIVELAELQKKESELNGKLMEKRLQLVQWACLNAAKHQSERR